MDGHSAAAAATLLNSYVQLPHSTQPPLPPPQLSMQSTSPQMVENFEQHQDQYGGKQKRLSGEGNAASLKKSKAGDDDSAKIDDGATAVVASPDPDEKGKEEEGEEKVDAKAEIGAASP